MPRGNPSKQTIASEKYQKKAGYRNISFKMKGDLPDRFSEKCKELGVPKARAIAELMQEFIDRNGGDNGSIQR